MKNLLDQGFRASKVEGSAIAGTRDYINGHDLLPSSYPNMKDKEIDKAINDLKNKKCDQQTKMTAIMILAHAGTQAAHQALLDYQKIVTDKQLQIWTEIAIGESKMWLED